MHKYFGGDTIDKCGFLCISNVTLFWVVYIWAWKCMPFVQCWKPNYQILYNDFQALWHLITCMKITSHSLLWVWWLPLRHQLLLGHFILCVEMHRGNSRCGSSKGQHYKLGASIVKWQLVRDYIVWPALPHIQQPNYANLWNTSREIDQAMIWILLYYSVKNHTHDNWNIDQLWRHSIVQESSYHEYMLDMHVYIVLYNSLPHTAVQSKCRVLATVSPAF